MNIYARVCLPIFGKMKVATRNEQHVFGGHDCLNSSSYQCRELLTLRGQLCCLNYLLTKP